MFDNRTCAKRKQSQRNNCMFGFTLSYLLTAPCSFIIHFSHLFHSFCDSVSQMNWTLVMLSLEIQFTGQFSFKMKVIVDCTMSLILESWQEEYLPMTLHNREVMHFFPENECNAKYLIMFIDVLSNFFR